MVKLKRRVKEDVPVKRKAGRPFGTKRPKLTIDGKKVEASEVDTLNIMITSVFDKNKDANSLVVVNRGGARSSKSYSIMQLLVERFFTYQGRRILVLRKTLPALKLTTYKMMKEYVENINLMKYIKEDRQMLDWNYGKSYLHFGSLDDPQKIRSSDWNDIWLEEATEFDYADYMTLKTRMSSPITGKIIGAPLPPPNQMFMSFNPDDEFHWIKSRVVDGEKENVIEIHSSWKDNPFLNEVYIKQLLDLEMQDSNFYRIYTLGEWGKLDTLIYPHWEETSKHLDTPEYIYGLDFGFNAPSALVKIHYDESELAATVEEKVYESGLTNAQLIRKCMDAVPLSDVKDIRWYADNAEPDRIKEFEDAGFYILPTQKGAGSVKEGIDFLKRFKVGMLLNSPNIIKERKSYSWKKDRKTERVIDEPIKWNDHALDAMRGALHTHWKEVVSGGIRIRVLNW